MSSDEGDKKIDEEPKDNGTAEEVNGDSDSSEPKISNDKGKKKRAVDPPKIKQPAKKRVKTEQIEKDTKNDEKKDKKSKEEEEEVEESENDDGGNKGVPLLDQPLEVEGSRRRKEVQRFIPINPEEDTKEFQIPEGKGKALGEIERIQFNLKRARLEDLKILHRLCFGKQGKAAVLTKNIQKFNGFDFEEASDEYEKRKTILSKNKKGITVAHLKNVANIIDLEKKTGPREDLLERIFSFLVCPVDSGKKLPGGGRSKRKGVEAKNYDEGEQTYKSRKKTRGKKKSESGESDEDKSEEEGEEDDKGKVEKEEVKKSEKKKPKSQINNVSKSENENNEEEEEAKEKEAEKEKELDDKEEELEEEEEEEKKPKRGAKKGKKVKEVKEKAPPKKRAAAKKAVEKEESEDDEDEPLAKKVKSPPTDEELKSYVKSLLDGADLELITMKKVCHDVYAHYPDFDLSHKKDFIKTTVKSLISS